MNIRKAPIADFMDFLYEDRDTIKQCNSIIDAINKYYSIIEHVEIAPKVTAKETILKDWCFGDYSYDMSNIPVMDGLLVVDKNNNWGITTRCLERTNNSVIKVVMVKHYCETLTFHPEDWVAYGYISKLFAYPKYEDHCNIPFGSRILRPNDNGNDVYIFQTILHKFNSSLQLTGEFDKDTFQTYVQAQKAYGLKLQNEYNPEEDQLIPLLCNGH